MVFIVSFWIGSWVVCRHVSNDAWYRQPPKPIGDGPDYDALGFSLAENGLWAGFMGDGLRIDTASEQWRKPYQNAVDTAPDTQGEPNYSDLLQKPATLLISTGRPPLFPVLLSAVYKSIGRTPDGFASVRILLALCVSLSISLSAVLSAQITFRILRAKLPDDAQIPIWPGVIAAMVTLALGASNNTLRNYATDFLTEPLALLLFQFFVMLVTAERFSQHRRLAIAAGSVFGLLILTRSMFVLWGPGIWCIVMLAHGGRPWGRFRAASIWGVACCLVCLPWWMRNYRVTDGYSMLGTKGAITLMGGYCDASIAASGDWQYAPERVLRNDLAVEKRFAELKTEPIVRNTQFEVMLAKRSRSELNSWLAANLQYVPGLVGMRIATHWNPYTGKSLVWKLAAFAGLLALVVCRRREAIWFIGLPMLSTLVVAALYSVGGRFLVPLYGILFCLPGIAVGACAVGFLVRREKQ